MDRNYKPRFSIIIPIYNTERTIKRCIESIQAQTYSNYEVLLIDDGSSDNSKYVIEDSIQADCRFCLYRLEKNGGPSAARNYGLEKCGGGIIVFVDADDYVCSQWLEIINEQFESTGADIVFYEYYRKDVDGRLSRRSLPEFQGEFFKDIAALTNNDMFGYTWLKAIKRSVIGDIHFDNALALFEDEVFTCAVLSENKVNMAYCHVPLYIYVADNQLSLSRKVNPEYPYCCEKVYQAWKILLNGKMDELLIKKATHMFENCKWYGLERNVNPLLFWAKLNKCSFITASSRDDRFSRAVKSNRSLYLLLYWIKYKLRNMLSSLKNVRKE